VLRLSSDLESAQAVDTLTDPDLAVPTTLAASVGRQLGQRPVRNPPGVDVPFETVNVDGP